MHLIKNKHWYKACSKFNLPIQEILIFLVISSPLLSNFATAVETEEICGDIDIRNSVKHFNKLQNCTVIEGVLQILLIDRGEPSDYSNLTFPKLREITGFLLLYRVSGLTTLAHIFPNLAVIHGAKLFQNSALIIYEMMSLQEIGLVSLTVIQRGSVHIERNPQLCYVDTIDWGLIARNGKSDIFIKNNKESNQCPNNCPVDKRCPTKKHKDRDISLCWNKHHCQKTCPACPNHFCTPSGDKCCHDYCLGGCTGETRNKCFACKNVVYQGQCLQKCHPQTYEFANRRCITDKECFKMDTKKLGLYERSKNVSWKLFQNKCLSECPEGYMTDEKNETTCVKCHNSCPKVCHGGIVDSISAIQALCGCTKISGHLEIKIQGGSNIVQELEECFSSLKEVEEYVKITQSFSLISLNFMKNLERIYGKRLESNLYSFYVFENNNLQELITSENRAQLNIDSGRVFFYNNPKLCKNKIEKFLNESNFTNFNVDDVSSLTNGDRGACRFDVLKARVARVTSTVVLIQWENFKTKSKDYRKLLLYLVSYKEAPDKNVSLYDGRNACGADSWKVDDVRPGLNDSDTGWEQYLLSDLKPFTQYAVSIKTSTISRENMGAESPILFFKTMPDTPSSPLDVRTVSTSSSSLIVSWLKPSKPNGTITHYIVKGYAQPYNQEYLLQRDYCLTPLIIPDSTKKSVDPDPSSRTNKTTNYWSHPNAKPEQCCECPEEKPSLTDEEREIEAQIHFEDSLHNYVYIKRSSDRHKRSVDFNEVLTSTVEPPLINRPSNISFVPETNELVPAEIFHNTTNITKIEIFNLTHFSEYSIEVVACQDAIEKKEKLCSAKAIATAKTARLETADDINSESVDIKVLNDTSGKVFIKWKAPENPNGLIVTYQLECRKMSIKNYIPTHVCITQSQYLKEGGYSLNNLPPGNYSIRVHAVSLAGNGNWTEPKYFMIWDTAGGVSSEVIIIAVVGGILLFILVFGGIIFFVIKKYLHKIPNGVLYASVNPEYMSTVYVPDEWEIPREKITLLRELGQGSFGMVYEGIIKDFDEEKLQIRCAIKTVNETASLRERIEFLNEASVMKAFSCHHVVKLIGVVSKGQPTFVVMELMVNGDLKSYLRLHRPDSEDAGKLPPPTLKQILQMACEIADGMAYLAAKKFVHRDLAARNCMVSEDLTVKIGDFGMTRDIYETDYYRKGGKGLLPVRWMAPESLKDGIFTSQSDVWSYGIVLWEMATLASQPYQGLSNEQVLKYVIEGGFMEKPENCPDKLYNLMTLCWAHNPKFRPSFPELVNLLMADASPSFHQVSFTSTLSKETSSYDVLDVDEVLPTTPLKSNSHHLADKEREANYTDNSLVKENYFPGDDRIDYLDTNEDTKENKIYTNEQNKGRQMNEALANGHVHFPLTNNVEC